MSPKHHTSHLWKDLSNESSLYTARKASTIEYYENILRDYHSFSGIDIYCVKTKELVFGLFFSPDPFFEEKERADHYKFKNRLVLYRFDYPQAVAIRNYFYEQYQDKLGYGKEIEFFFRIGQPKEDVHRL
ncbi:MAG: hypothetical protein KC535_04155 [Nanoarchaeota archaeon]|nr:hypothetical protein [Nanoarchaeota archaeon]